MPVAELNNELGRVDVRTEFREKDLIKSVPGAKYDAERRTWHAPLTWATCKQLRGVFGERLEIGQELRAWATREMSSRVAPSLELRTMIDPDGFGFDSVLPEYLYPFQRCGLEFMRLAKKALHGGQQRTGKMYQGVGFLQVTDDAFPALVISPNSVKRRWLRKIQELAPEIRAAVIEGSAKRRREVIQLAKDGELDVVIVNWEALRTLSRLAPYGSVALKRCVDCGGEAGVKPQSCEAHARDLNAIPWRTVIADEAHRMKDPKAKQTRAAWWLAREAEYVFPMTGTPIANHPGDLWSLMHLACPEEYPSRVKFIDRYCLVAPSEWGGLEIVGISPRTEHEFHEIFDPRFVRHLREQVRPQMPRAVRDVREIELPAKQRKIYDQLRDEAIAALDGGTLTAFNGLALSTRLSQLACATGEMIDDPSTPDGKKLRLVEPSCKVAALVDLLTDYEDERVAVFAESRQLLELVETRLRKDGVPFGSIHGGISEAQREMNELAFQGGSLRVILFNVAGGEGLDFGSADVMVFLQRSWSAVRNSQAEDRVMNIDRVKPIAVIDVVARDTVDEYRRQVMFEKYARLEEVVQDQAALRRLITGEGETG